MTIEIQVEDGNVDYAKQRNTEVNKNKNKNKQFVTWDTEHYSWTPCVLGILILLFFFFTTKTEIPQYQLFCAFLFGCFGSFLFIK